MNDQVLQFIKQAIEGVEYGAVNFTVMKHDSLVSSADANKNSNYRVNGNAEALAMVAQLIKAVTAQIKTETQQPIVNYTPPNLTFTIFFHKDGGAERINVNDFKRRNFK